MIADTYKAGLSKLFFAGLLTVLFMVNGCQKNVSNTPVSYTGDWNFRVIGDY